MVRKLAVKGKAALATEISTRKSLVRGFQDKKILEERPAVYVTLLEKLYENRNHLDLRWAESELRTNKLYAHVPLPSDFPTDSDPFKPWSLASIRSPLVRCATVIDRINQSERKLISCLKSLHKINVLIFERNINSAVLQLEQHVNEFGISHAALRKFAFLRAVYGEEKLSHAPSLLAKANISKRDIVRPSLLDIYSPRRQFLDVARNIFRISSARNLTKYRRTISAFAACPFSYSVGDFEDGLEAFSKASLVDATIFLDLHLGSSWEIEYLKEYGEIWATASEQVRLAIKEFSCDVPILEKIIAEKFDQTLPDDYNIYRYTSAFIECENIRAFRCVSDFYLLRKPETMNEPRFVAHNREKIFGRELNIQLIAKANSEVKFDVSKFNAKTAGTFQKTIATAIYFANRTDFSGLDEQTFVSLMNCTTGADQVISRRVLLDLKRIAQENSDLLFRVIVLCLLAVDLTDAKSEYELRRASQELVESRFDSSFAKLVDYLLKTSQQVGLYIYQIATEDFLLQLYHIHKTSADAIECRAALHEIMYAREGEKVFKDRADSLRLSAKIAKARQDLDDSRIYVDLGRFANWLKEQRLLNMLQYMRAGAVDVEALDAISIKEINASQGIEAEISRELAAIYREFCSNKIFGIASYLGRRIRHGTLRGTLLQDIDNLVFDRFPELSENQTFFDYFQEWRSGFDDFIRRMGSDYFHIRSAQKPHGMISPEISEAKKLSFIKSTIRAMAQNVDRFEEPDYYVGLIADMCWQIASVDLRNAYRIISNCKVLARVSITSEPVRASMGPYLRDYVRFMNEHIEEKFNTVSNWFDRPKISIPSVDLPTLIRVVNEEVFEEFPDYEPPAIDDSSSRIVLSGATYHVVYDFLYVTLKNAARHGRPGGLVSLLVEQEVTGEVISSLVFTVVSEYKDGDTPDLVKARIMDLRSSSLDSAYVEEGNSGLKKIIRLESDWPEVDRVEITPAENEFIVRLGMRMR